MNTTHIDRSDALSPGQGDAAVLSLGQADVLLSALQGADGRIDSMMRGLNIARQSLLGQGHMTVNVTLNPDAGPDDLYELHRIWSSNPGFDAVGGRKRKEEKPWTRTVLRESRMFVGEGDTAITGSFDDHERLRGLDLHAIVNVPIAMAGHCLATLNVLTTRHKWTAPELALIRLFALVARSSILRRRDEVLLEIARKEHS